MNPERQKEHYRRWKEKFPEKVRALAAAWQKKNPDKVREYSLRYYRKNRNKYLAERRAKGIQPRPRQRLTSEEKQQKLREYNRAYSHYRRKGNSAPLEDWRRKWHPNQED